MQQARSLLVGTLRPLVFVRRFAFVLGYSSSYRNNFARKRDLVARLFYMSPFLYRLKSVEPDLGDGSLLGEENLQLASQASSFVDVCIVSYDIGSEI